MHIHIHTYIHVHIPPLEKIPKLGFCIDAEHTESLSVLGVWRCRVKQCSRERGLLTKLHNWRKTNLFSQEWYFLTSCYTQNSLMC